jgi:hypothetical protein
MSLVAGETDTELSFRDDPREFRQRCSRYSDLDIEIAYVNVTR